MLILQGLLTTSSSKRGGQLVFLIAILSLVVVLGLIYSTQFISTTNLLGDRPFTILGIPAAVLEEGDDDEIGGDDDRPSAANFVEDDETKPAAALPKPITIVVEKISGNTIWDLPLNDIGTSQKNSHLGTLNIYNSSLVFVRGIKVGSTSVNTALSRVERKFNLTLSPKTPGTYYDPSIAPPRNKKVDCAPYHKVRFHFFHGYRRPWMKLCLPDIKLITLLRSPFDQTLAYGAYRPNFYFLEHLPQKTCTKRTHLPLTETFDHVNFQEMHEDVWECKDLPVRKNLTAMYVAKQIQNYQGTLSKPIDRDPFYAAQFTGRWIAHARDYTDVTSEKLIEKLKNEYFLVGITERINEFLVLIATAYGWDLSDVYYMKCKVNTELNIDKKLFQKVFPKATEKIKNVTQPMVEVYEWAKTQFDEHVRYLGPWFKQRVQEYEAGLKEFQKAMHQDTNHTAWTIVHLADGYADGC